MTTAEEYKITEGNASTMSSQNKMKECIEFLDGYIQETQMSDPVRQQFQIILETLQKRLNAGRPKIHASPQARWQFHNARRREKARQADEVTA